MNGRSGVELFHEACTNGRQLCVGLDPSFDRLPTHILEAGDEDDPRRHPFSLFCAEIVKATSDLAGCFKPNTAFWEAAGWRGVRALQEWLIPYIREVAPHALLIGDTKRGDVGNTVIAHGKAMDAMGYDAMTVNPYGGYEEGLEELITRHPDKLIIVWIRSSNRGARALQDRIDKATGLPMWQFTARNIFHIEGWNELSNCGLVCGANHPGDMEWLRDEVGISVPFLAPAIGAQGGDLIRAVQAGGGSTVFSTSRQLLYASSGRDFAVAARAVAEQANATIQQALTTGK